MERRSVMGRRKIQTVQGIPTGIGVIGSNICRARSDGHWGRKINLLPACGRLVIKIRRSQERSRRRPEGSGVKATVGRSFVEADASNTAVDVGDKLDSDFDPIRIALGS